MRAEEVVRELGLSPHPEGGFYREVFRDPAMVAHPVHGAPRAAMTSIYFLLPAGSFSALHRVAQSEVWNHLAGDPLDLHVFEHSRHLAVRLGPDLAAGERPQHIVPARAWQAAVPRGGSWSLCSCTVAPGFDFADFDMPPRKVMLRELAAHVSLVMRLTRADTVETADEAHVRTVGGRRVDEFEVAMPPIGEVREGRVTRIDVSIGDVVTPGAVLLEIDTDKATLEIPVDQHARVVAVLASVGDVVSPGTPLVRLVPA